MRKETTNSRNRLKTSEKSKKLKTTSTKNNFMEINLRNHLKIQLTLKHIQKFPNFIYKIGITV